MQNNIFSTVVRRLTLSYTLLFGVLSLGAFLLVYVHIAHNLNQQTDARLRATVRELIKTRNVSLTAFTVVMPVVPFPAMAWALPW